MLSHLRDVYLGLYRTKLGEKVVNGVGQKSFKIIRKALQEAMVMGTARLIDPLETRQHKNMPIELIIGSGSEEDNAFITELNRIKEELCPDILELRNKVFAHRDRKYYEDWTKSQHTQDDSESKEIKDTNILEAVQAIIQLMTDWLKKVSYVKIEFDDSRDVTELLHVLHFGQSHSSKE